MEQSNKAHRTAKPAGAKKKLHTQGHNAKAFAVSAPNKMMRQAMRSHDVNEKKLHVPMVDRTPDDDPPPVIIAVVGPPGTGKTTLIKSLIRRLTKTTVGEINGPVTVVSGKRRRLTFIEVANDLNSMIDAAKVADLVLLMIDGNFGLEMETMEFLNIAQHHGMPRVLGVTTHIDLFKSQSTLRTAKKRLKTRFWTEVYAGAKLFYLSGVVNGRYPDREILNLTRFISVMKFRPLKWRNEHPYLMADRVTDLTHPEVIQANPKCDRKIALYGYLHGTPLSSNKETRVHIAGVGDCTISSVEKLPDPCPTPFFQQRLDEIEREQLKAAQAKGEEVASTTRRRKRLDDKQKLIYAPMSDLGGVLMDKDAVYIDVGTESFVPGEEQGEGEKLVTDLHNVESKGFEGVGLQLFSESKPMEEEDEDEDAEEVDSDAEFDDEEEELNLGDDNEDRGRHQMRRGRVHQPTLEEVDFDEPQPETDDEFHLSEDEYTPGSKLRGSVNKRYTLNKLIYEPDLTPSQVLKKWLGTEEEPEEENIEDDDEDFFRKTEDSEDADGLENFKPVYESTPLEDMLAKLKDRFVGAPIKSGDDNEDEEVYGDFEDLETGETHEAEEKEVDDFPDFEAEEKKADAMTVDEERAMNAAKKEKLRQQFEIEEGDNFNEEDPENEFDTWYELQKAKMAKQIEINNMEYADMDTTTRTNIEGYKAGSYVRLVFENMPPEFIENFNPKFPVIVGGLLATELKFGIMTARIRRHRWHKKILKTNDPLVLSLGWRRFQTLPVYTTSDSRTRTRMLKYTPEHAYCNASFYGPLVAPNTTFCGVQVVANSDTTGSFRISATGIVEEIDSSKEIVKKLKLVGYPSKIFKNTAFVKGMFNTALEVARFEGAQIKTVSGIRGEIKRALAKPEGEFRATFEDKILLSDIVIMRTWYPVQVKKFYNPVTSLLLKDKTEWRGLRLTGAIRAANNIATPMQADSAYGKVERQERHFNGLKVPKSIAKELPFKSQISQMKPQKKKTYMAKRAVVVGGDEKKARAFMQKVHTISNAKSEKAKSKKDDQRKERLKKLAKLEDIKTEKDKERKKEYFSKVGKKRSGGSSEDGPSKKRK